MACTTLGALFWLGLPLVEFIKNEVVKIVPGVIIIHAALVGSSLVPCGHMQLI